MRMSRLVAVGFGVGARDDGVVVIGNQLLLQTERCGQCARCFGECLRRRCQVGLSLRGHFVLVGRQVLKISADQGPEYAQYGQTLEERVLAFRPDKGGFDPLQESSAGRRVRASVGIRHVRTRNSRNMKPGNLSRDSPGRPPKRREYLRFFELPAMPTRGVNAYSVPWAGSTAIDDYGSRFSGSCLKPAVRSFSPVPSARSAAERRCAG
jgi:hypothetical protein